MIWKLRRVRTRHAQGTHETWSCTCQGSWPHWRCTIQAVACSTEGSDQHGERGWQDSGRGGGTVQRGSVYYFPAGVRALGLGTQKEELSRCSNSRAKSLVCGRRTPTNEARLQADPELVINLNVIKLLAGRGQQHSLNDADVPAREFQPVPYQYTLAHPIRLPSRPTGRRSALGTVYRIQPRLGWRSSLRCLQRSVRRSTPCYDILAAILCSSSPTAFS